MLFDCDSVIDEVNWFVSQNAASWSCEADLAIQRFAFEISASGRRSFLACFVDNLWELVKLLNSSYRRTIFFYETITEWFDHRFYFVLEGSLEWNPNFQTKNSIALILRDLTENFNVAHSVVLSPSGSRTLVFIWIFLILFWAMTRPSKALLLWFLCFPSCKSLINVEIFFHALTNIRIAEISSLGFLGVAKSKKCSSDGARAILGLLLSFVEMWVVQGILCVGKTVVPKAPTYKLYTQGLGYISCGGNTQQNLDFLGENNLHMESEVLPAYFQQISFWPYFGGDDSSDENLRNLLPVASSFWKYLFCAFFQDPRDTAAVYRLSLQVLRETIRLAGVHTPMWR